MAAPPPADAPPRPPGALGTEAVRADLPRRAVRSGAVAFAAQPVKLAVGAVAMAVLARLLRPADFGLIAMTTPLVALVMALRNLGVDSAMVQREDLSHGQMSALYWWTQGVNGAVFVAMAAAGPALAWFYGEPALVGVTAALAAGHFVFALAMPHEALVMRQMRFEALTALQLGAVVVGVAVALGAAALGAGYWALVLELAVPQVVVGVGLWALCPWRPGRPRRLDRGAREMVAYGGHLTGYRLLSRLADQLDRVLIGYASGAAALGLYDIARRWGYLPVERVYQPLSSVAVAGFSRAQGHPARYRSHVRRGVLPVFALVLPALAFAWAEADALLPLLLGPQWGGAVPIFRVLVAGFAVDAVGKVAKWFYLAEGATRRQLRWGLVATPVQVAALVVGARWGALGVAWALTASTVVLTPAALAYCLRASPVRWADLGHALWRPAVATAVAAGALGLAGPGGAGLVALGLRTGLFGVAYAAAWLALPGGRAEAAALLRRLRAARRPAP